MSDIPHMDLPPASNLQTHEVQNQPDSGWAGDIWATDPALSQAVAAFSGDAAALARHAATLGEMRAVAATINRQSPELVLFDRAGRRLDEISFHPGYHDFMKLGLEGGYVSGPWSGAAGGHVTHAAMVYLHSQIEPGTCCPMTMTYAAVPVLRKAEGVGSSWAERANSGRYDPTVRPIGDKSGVTLGMAMTEKQGGSDVRTNTTRAERSGRDYLLTGHKWFCSAPMSDGFLALAQTEGGLTCFLVPRWLKDGRNAIHLMRLKDKLGNRSNASAEIEFAGALSYRIGEEGAGVRTIIEMVHHTRLDTAMAPAGLMRAALAEAMWWCEHRTAFQRRLIDQPLMRAVLADLALEAEAALWLGLRVAHAFDSADEQEKAFARVAVALAKFLSNKRCPNVVYEAMEALGGMGYVEDTPMPMLYREAPLNSIWEGSGNVICLDILRSLQNEPATGQALVAELEAARGRHKHYDAALSDFLAGFGDVDSGTARIFAERAALMLTASVLLRFADNALAESFVNARLGAGTGRVAGASRGIDVDGLLSRY